MERQAVLSRGRHHRGFKHVFLDLDGTVTDPREGIVRSIQHSLNKLGRKLPDDCNFERFIGPSLANAFSTLLDAAVGDREDDVTAARRNRVAAIAVTWGYGSLEELENAGPQWLVHTPRELLTCLGAAIGRE